MYVYADNAATTQVHPAALEAMVTCMRDVYGNPSSLHTPGQKAKEALETARCYFVVIGCFIAGAALGGLLLPWMGRWTALAAVLLQLGAFLWMCL